MLLKFLKNQQKKNQATNTGNGKKPNTVGTFYVQKMAAMKGKWFLYRQQRGQLESVVLQLEVTFSGFAETGDT